MNASGFREIVWPAGTGTGVGTEKKGYLPHTPLQEGWCEADVDCGWRFYRFWLSCVVKEIELVGEGNKAAIGHYTK